MIAASKLSSSDLITTAWDSARTYRVTDKRGAVRCMRMALKTSRNKIDYINTHGTSTPVGDITELKAVGQVFNDYKPKISSTKSLAGQMFLEHPSLFSLDLVFPLHPLDLHKRVENEMLQAALLKKNDLVDHHIY